MPRPPFDWGIALAYLGRSPQERLDIVADGQYRRAVRLGGRPAVLQVGGAGSVDAPALEVSLLEPINGRAHLPVAEQLVRRCFRLDEDPRDLDRVAAADPTFGAVLARMRGARAIVMVSPFESLIWAILGQQITIAFAYKLKRALIERYGDTVDHAGQRYYLFPRAARLAELDPAELRELQLSRQKAAYVVGLAGLEAGGAIDWDALAGAPTEEAVAALTRHRGIGRWTAEYVCMRGLGHPDVIPAGDLGLRAAIGRAYGLGRVATEPEVRTLADGWAGWRSHAAFCWWHSLTKGAGISAEGRGAENA